MRDPLRENQDFQSNFNPTDTFRNPTKFGNHFSMGFFRLQTSYLNLPKQVDILSPSIQIVFQNIENSSIREHVKIGLKTANFR